MKRLDYIFLSLATATFMIGLDQIIRASIPVEDIYWIFMLSLGFAMLVSYRRVKRKEAESQNVPEPIPNKKEKAAKKKGKK